MGGNCFEVGLKYSLSVPVVRLPVGFLSHLFLVYFLPHFFPGYFSRKLNLMGKLIQSFYIKLVCGAFLEYKFLSVPLNPFGTIFFDKCAHSFRIIVF